MGEDKQQVSKPGAAVAIVGALTLAGIEVSEAEVGRVLEALVAGVTAGGVLWAFGAKLVAAIRARIGS